MHVLYFGINPLKVAMSWKYALNHSNALLTSWRWTITLLHLEVRSSIPSDTNCFSNEMVIYLHVQHLWILFQRSFNLVRRRCANEACDRLTQIPSFIFAPIPALKQTLSANCGDWWKHFSFNLNLNNPWWLLGEHQHQP